MDRRKFLQLLGVTASGVVASSGMAQSDEAHGGDMAEAATAVADVADIENLNPVLQEVLGVDFDALQESDAVAINAPAIAESGANVPLEIMVDIDAANLKAIHGFVDRNPLPHIFSIGLGPLSSQNYFTTRIRIAETAPIRVVAETNDGQYLLGSAVTRVTVGGCG